MASAMMDKCDQNIVHRDIKPENLIIYKEVDILMGNFGTVDFLKNVIEGKKVNHRSRTLHWRSFEYFDLKQRFSSAAQDLYTAGVTLYEFCKSNMAF